jgi:hypothetical protein
MIWGEHYPIWSVYTPNCTPRRVSRLSGILSPLAPCFQGATLIGGQYPITCSRRNWILAGSLGITVLSLPQRRWGTRKGTSSMYMKRLCRARSMFLLFNARSSREIGSHIWSRRLFSCCVPVLRRQPLSLIRCRRRNCVGFTWSIVGLDGGSPLCNIAHHCCVLILRLMMFWGQLARIGEKGRPQHSWIN